jgi:hypothetical protein
MKTIDVLKEAVFLIMISLMFSIGTCEEDDAKVTPTPTPTATATAEPTPTACCPENYNQVESVTLVDPKLLPRTLGEMSDLYIYQDSSK